MSTFTYTAPVSIFPSSKLDGSPSRRLVLSVKPEELANVPAELFAVKVSQSKNPQKTGTLRFKYFAFKANDTAQWSDQASTNFNVATPVEEIKAAVVAAIGANPAATVQFTVNMPGKFATSKPQTDVIHCLTSMKTQMETLATILKEVRL